MIDLPLKRYRFLARIIIFLRIATPLLIWLNPFVIPVLCQVLDGLDYVMITNGKMMSKSSYQRLDKFLDFYYLLIMFFVSIYWGNVVLIVLFIYRLIGFIIVLITHKRIFFVFFNNSFEWMYNLFSYGYVYNPSFLQVLNENIVIFLIAIFLLKTIPEVYIHYLNFDSTFFNIGLIKKKR